MTTIKNYLIINYTVIRNAIPLMEGDTIKSLCVSQNEDKRRLEFINKRKPEIQKDQVSIKVLYAGICGTDLKLLHGTYPIEEHLFPMTLGHEFIGQVCDVGTLIPNVHLGDYVTGKPTVSSCMKCSYCNNGKINLCKKRLRMGINTDGAFAEYITLNHHQIIKMPKLEKLEVGALLEPLSVVARGITQVNITPNQNVCVFGPGTIGMLTALMMKEYGCHITLVGTKSDAKRLQYAKEIGITDEVMTNDQLSNIVDYFDVVSDCTGVDAAINQSLDCIRPSGQFLLLGTSKQLLPINFSKIVYKELNVTGTIGANELDWEYALKVLKRNESLLEKLIIIKDTTAVQEAFLENATTKPKTILKF